MSEQNTETATPVKTTREYYLSLRLGTYGGITFLTVLSRVVPTVKILAIIIVVAYTGYMVIDTFRDFTIMKSHRPNESFLTALIHGNMNDFFYLMLSLIIGFIL